MHVQEVRVEVTKSTWEELMYKAACLTLHAATRLIQVKGKRSASFVAGEGGEKPEVEEMSTERFDQTLSFVTEKTLQKVATHG